MSAMSTLASVDQPLAISTSGIGGKGAGTLDLSDFSMSGSGGSQSHLIILASSMNEPPIAEHEVLAVESLREAFAGATPRNAAETMKLAFREANRRIHQSAPESESGEFGGVSLLALVTSGKYATIGMAGEDRAYLSRASRLTQLTRDQRVVRARSRRKQDAANTSEQPAGAAEIRLPGEAERLDTRLPAIFEITLLPEDRIALLSRGAVDALSEDRILASMTSGVADLSQQLAMQVTSDGNFPVLVATLAVAPVRETRPVITVPAGGPMPIWIPLVVLLLLIAVVAAAALLVL